MKVVSVNKLVLFSLLNIYIYKLVTHFFIKGVYICLRLSYQLLECYGIAMYFTNICLSNCITL